MGYFAIREDTNISLSLNNLIFENVGAEIC